MKLYEAKASTIDVVGDGVTARRVRSWEPRPVCYLVQCRESLGQKRGCAVDIVGIRRVEAVAERMFMVIDLFIVDHESSFALSAFPMSAASRAAFAACHSSKFAGADRSMRTW
jgi:hypothetical protein